MNHAEERDLYATDRGAWVAYVAPSMARSLANMDDDAVNRTWPQLSRDYQKAVWDQLDETTRDRLRKVRK